MNEPRYPWGGNRARFRAMLAHCLIAALLSFGPSAFAWEAAPRPRSGLADVKALDKPVTYTETKTPLGELVQKVAADTGVKLTAARDVADEPVAVVVKELPARELLEQLAELLDYRWERHGKEGAWRYEIWQDLASKLREKALRDALTRETERRFQQEVHRFAEVAALPPEQITALADEGERREQEPAKLPLEQQMALVRDSQDSERLRRAGMARQLSAPVPRAIAQLIGRLTSRQWEILRAENQITFSSDPRRGEQLMPAEIDSLLRHAQPTMYPPGTRVLFPGSGDEQQAREAEKSMQEQWAAAPGYHVTLQMNAGRLNPEGSLMLNASAAPNSGGDAGSARRVEFEQGSSLFMGASAVESSPLAEERTPQRRAELDKDPLLGTAKSFKPEAKPRPMGLFPGGPVSWRLRDLLPDLARTYKAQFIADAYTNSAAGFQALQPPAAEPVALYVLLDRLTGPTYHWDRRGELIRLRSRTWFLERPSEIPLRMVRRWDDLFARNGALPLEEYLRMVTELRDEQLDGLLHVTEEMKSPAARQLLTASMGTGVLRLYALLPPEQQQALRGGRILQVREMLPAQRPFFLAALREANRHHMPPLDLQQWTTGSLSVEVQKGVPAGPPLLFGPFGGAPPGLPAPSPAAAPGGPLPQVASRPGAPPASGTGSAPAPQRPVDRMSFRLQFGAEGEETVALLVAPPP